MFDRDLSALGLLAKDCSVKRRIIGWTSGLEVDLLLDKGL